MENDMARYVARKGILPVLIPEVSPDIQLDILQEMDGFILQGGVDLAPETYGETPIGRWKGDVHRDQYELAILDFAIKNNKPILGICRGFQLMNVYFGGKLFQDTLTQNKDKNDHRSAKLYDKISHPVEWVEGTYLAELYKADPATHVNSVHHQAIKSLGNDLEVYAYSDDGLIEAFGYTKAPSGAVMGVQWHPEFSHTLKDKVIDPNILFQAFVKNMVS